MKSMIERAISSLVRIAIILVVVVEAVGVYALVG
jgi:F0F1-type ATP synthase membrane subunit c/vacuolar-type H+-ATPase subunit K